jgi:arylsulfatase
VRGGGRYLYRSAAAPIPSCVAVNIFDRAHRITANITIPDGGGQGVILAHGGGSFGGYALFVQDGHLRYTYRNSGNERYEAASASALRPGPQTVGVEFTRTGERRGTAELRVDGRTVASVNVERMSSSIGDADEGLCCGYDSGRPVGDYVTPFRFNGTIERVVVEVEEREVTGEGLLLRRY